MSLWMRRRDVFAAGLAGLGMSAAPGHLLAATLGRGFTHGVASGEPTPRSVLLWTRFISGGDSAGLRVELAEDSEFGRIRASAEPEASATTDFCAKAVVEGLEPDRWYFYRFHGPDGSVSPTGRTRTLPDGPSAQFRMAVFSCANLPFGWFNAYAHAAKADDCDLVVHLGDYIYEFPAGFYPDAAHALAGRTLDPQNEAVSLADYHRRYAVYRADPDLQRLHQLFPMIATWDDHEFANDAWKGGAENHQPATEGSWEARKAAAKAAFRHWLPVSDTPYAAYDIGDLATIFRLDTRVEGRDPQIDVGAALKGAADPKAALTALRSAWADPRRSMLGMEQERWLSDALAASTKAGKRWQVLAQQVLVGTTFAPPASTGWVRPETAAQVMPLVKAALAIGQVGMPSSMDTWGGYPAARSRLLKSAQEANANLVVLAGDSHNAWAFDLSDSGAPAGVEFGGTSVTSPGYEAYFSADPAVIAREIEAVSPELRWADTSRRGYMHVTLTPDEARSEWRLLETVRQRSTALAGSIEASTRRGTNTLELA